MKTKIDLDNKTLTIDGIEYEFKKKLSNRYPIGTIVRDNDSELAIIVQDNPSGTYELRLIQVENGRTFQSNIGYFQYPSDLSDVQLN